MLSRKADGPVLVQVPGPAQDRPSWRRVGTIAAVGFVVGIAWPRLAGVRLGPSLPDVPSAAAAAASTPAMQASAAVSPSVASPLASVGSAVVSAAASGLPPPVSPLPRPAFGSNGRTAPAGASASPRPGGDAADATGQVVWEVALVRDAPKTGKIVARLQRGVAVRLGPVKDGWYPVRYGDGFASDGWVYRGAIGR